jgi:hypothetical protein
VLGKENTVWDSRRAVDASFWPNPGPSAQLWGMADSQVTGDGVARLTSPAFADLWSVATVQAEYPAACINKHLFQLSVSVLEIAAPLHNLVEGANSLPRRGIVSV